MARELFIESHASVQFLLYLAISSIAAGVNLGVGFYLYAVAGLSAGGLYIFSVAVGYLTGMLVNWSLNRVITFPRSGRRRLAELRTFFVVAMIGLVLTVVLAGVFRSTLAGPVAHLIASIGQVSAPSAETVGQVMAIGLVAIYSFLSHKWLTFARGIRFQMEVVSRRLAKKLKQHAAHRTPKRSATFREPLTKVMPRE